MSSPSSLAQKIGFRTATAVIIGSIIGSGVFMKPATMASQLGSPVWLTLVWVIAGLFSLFGALIYAELGAMMPETGGIYVYFRKMFGDFIAFLYGWTAFSVINTSAIAAISFVCADYANYFLHLPRFNTITEQSVVWHLPFVGELYPLQNLGVKSLAIFLVVVLTWVNYRSVRAGGAFQLLSTIVKIAVIAALIFGILFSGKGDVQNFFHAENLQQGGELLSGIMAALTGAFFAFDGWINITYIAGEIKQPGKIIPRSLFTGVIACILIYVMVNQAYLYVLPVEQMAKSSLVASDAIGIVLGTAGQSIVAALIVICTLGAINGNVMATSRVTYAMGKDRVFAPWTGREHKRFQTPGNALWLHAFWIILFIITGSFDMLADMMVFMSWLVYGLGAVGIFLLRKKMPGIARPYKIWGHPVITILFILFAALFLTVTVYNDITNYLNKRQPVVNFLLGIAITALGVPFYFYFRRKAKNSK